MFVINRSFTCLITTKCISNKFVNITIMHFVVFKRDIHLPPHLFENIMLKGSESCWPIPTRFLKPCLANRDALNWVNVDVLQGNYEVSDLMKLQEAHLPLKQLSFRVWKMTPELISLIVKYSPCLEILHIGYYDNGGALMWDHLLFIS